MGSWNYLLYRSVVVVLEWGQGKGDGRTEGGTVGHKAMSIYNLLLFTDLVGR